MICTCPNCRHKFDTEDARTKEISLRRDAIDFLRVQLPHDRLWAIKLYRERHGTDLHHSIIGLARDMGFKD